MDDDGRDDQVERTNDGDMTKKNNNDSNCELGINAAVDLLIDGKTILAVQALAKAFKQSTLSPVDYGHVSYSWHDIPVDGVLQEDKNGDDDDNDINNDEPQLFLRAVKIEQVSVVDSDSDTDGDDDDHDENDGDDSRDDDDGKVKTSKTLLDQHDTSSEEDAVTVATTSTTHHHQQDDSSSSLNSDESSTPNEEKESMVHIVLRYNLAVACAALAKSRKIIGVKQQLLSLKAHRLFRDVLNCFKYDDENKDDSSGTVAPSISVGPLRYRNEIGLVLLLASANNQGCLCHQLSLFEASTLSASTVSKLLQSIPRHLHRRVWSRIQRNVALLQRPTMAGAA